MFILCLRYTEGIGESVGYFSGHYYDGMYIILDFRNIFLDIQLWQLVLGIIYFRSFNFGDSGYYMNSWS